MLLLLAGLTLLFALHSTAILAPEWRAERRLAWGQWAWSSLIVIGSLLAVSLIARGYSLTRVAPIMVYVPPAWSRQATDLLMMPVFPLAFATFLPGRIRSAVRYPDLLAISIWALAHLLANGMLADILLFGSFMVWAMANCISLRQRVRIIPSGAPSPYNDLVAVVAGTATYLVIVAYLHYRLIGVSPI